jgi:hypothetical protein
LEELLARGVNPEPEFLVFDALRHFVESEPFRTVQALRRYLHDLDNPWATAGHAPELEETLRTAISSGDPEAAHEAVETVHWLGSRGLRQFRSLLQGA